MRRNQQIRENLANYREQCQFLCRHLNEQDRRLVAGLLALAVGSGGYSCVAEIVGMDRETVAKGQRELQNQLKDYPKGRQRLPGGGRKPLEKKSPETVETFEKLVAENTGGMPTGKRKFVRLSLRNIADKVGKISPSTVGRWLHRRKYSLRSNVKRLSGPPHPDRDRQFRLIKRATTIFRNSGQPIISVDAKNKEKIGDFKNNGVKWEAEGKREEVDAHDFANKKTLTATPFAIYDVTKNEALVEVGTSKNTARFAVDSIWRWWFMYGIFAYATASRLLILADSGGSNGCRVWMWKKQLQEFADATGLTITVRHYPRGASPWNPVEHKVFGPISKNWAGHPLRSMDRLLGFIRGTTTRTGLKVRARWNRRKYKTKEKVSKEERKQLNFKRHKVIPLWNYTIYPRK